MTCSSLQKTKKHGIHYPKVSSWNINDHHCKTLIIYDKSREREFILSSNHPPSLSNANANNSLKQYYIHKTNWFVSLTILYCLWYNCLIFFLSNIKRYALIKIFLIYLELVYFSRGTSSYVLTTMILCSKKGFINLPWKDFLFYQNYLWDCFVNMHNIPI